MISLDIYFVQESNLLFDPPVAFRVSLTFPVVVFKCIKGSKNILKEKASFRVNQTPLNFYLYLVLKPSTVVES